MFLLPTFPLIDQIEPHVIIWKLISLGFMYYSCPIPSNGLICILKTSNIIFQNLEEKTYGF